MKPPSRSGLGRPASVTLEALLVLPVLLVVVLGGVELGLLVSTRHQLWGACREVGRLAACGHERVRLEGVLAQYLGEASSSKAELILADENGQTVFQPSDIPSGQIISVTLRLPATSAAPDLLRVFGLSLRDQIMEARTVWRRE